MSDQPKLAPEIVATIGGKTVSRSQILAWEDRRACAVMRKLGMDIDSADTATRRVALAERKLQLGHERIEALLGRPLRVSKFGTGALARLSAGRRRFSTIELAVNTVTSAAFVHWWNRHVVTGDEAPLLDICPDHWIVRPGLNGWQEIVETTGGSPLASRLFIDYHDVDSLQSSPDSRYDYQITAVARRHDGTPIGGLRHQLRDTATGFQMSLTAEFPALTPPNLITGHRWHLACEFANMSERALDQS
ncbi:hypothetical protein ABIA30_005406 [Mycobacterium sp. MAA66]|uniref:hypothetical protein n=1 Tax=Mycobacterium sp. MAA66 TaxID=3156297 RepID=UPI00351612D9